MTEQQTEETPDQTTEQQTDQTTEQAGDGGDQHPVDEFPGRVDEEAMTQNIGDDARSGGIADPESTEGKWDAYNRQDEGEQSEGQ